MHQKIHLACLLLLFSINHIKGQIDAKQKDSLLFEMRNGKTDTAKVTAYYAYGDLWFDTNKDTAYFYYIQGKELAHSKNNYLLEAFAHGYLIVLLNDEGKYKEALDLCIEAKLLFEKAMAQPKQMAIVHLNLGNEWQYLGSFKNAADNYFSGLRLAEIAKNIKSQAICINNLSSLYAEMHDTTNQLLFAQKAKTISSISNDSSRIFSAITNLVAAYLANKKFDKAFIELQNLKKLAAILNNPEYQLDADISFADYYMETKNNEQAIYFFKKVLEQCKLVGNKEYEIAAAKNLAKLYYESNNIDLAKTYATKTLAIAIGANAKSEEALIVKLMADIDEKNGKYPSALQLRKRYETIADTLALESGRKEILKLQAEYENEKKETQLKLQQSTIKQKNTLNILLGSIAAAILLVSLVSYKNYRNKQQLQQQKISELETQQQLSATEAVLKGEEQERTRLAKDLHDGLGGMLSGIKYSFNTMKGNLIMTPDNAQAFERSMDMLDSSIKEMRRVAHNMMPEALVKFGVDTALKDFCNDIQQSGALQISYQSIGTQNATIDQTAAITIYRIVQELINNTIKHAAAKKAIVQLTKSDNKLSVTVEDDGKGFDTAIINNPVGMGWSNITNRVDFLKGKLDVDSQHGKGTSVHIEINI
jgi:two-component system, NarL family, sensor kinase